ncbi:hypothetical protein GX411_06125 [Candidatus Fermentibacteria bacterium]|nr:hypothetical protein [Candidatus Fermentibacteria bacterium]
MRLRHSTITRPLAANARTALLLAAVLGASCLFEPVDLGEHGEFAAEFDLAWQTVDRTFPGFLFTPVDWDETYRNCSPFVDTVTTQMGLVELLASMTAPLEDATIRFMSPGGGILVQPFVPQIEPNFDMDVLWDYLEPAGFSWFQYDAWGACMFDSVPYVMIQSWSPGMSLTSLDDFLDAHPGAVAVIIDIRMNGGAGSGQRIAEIGRRFNDQTRVGYFSVGRDGPEWDDLCDPVPRLVHSRADWCQVPLVVLVGENCGWVSEEFACIASELPLAVLMGDTTQGQCSDCKAYELAGSWTMWLPDSTILQSDTVTWVQGRGIPPDIFVDATEEQFSQGIDPVLEYALDWAQSQ